MNRTFRSFPPRTRRAAAVAGAAVAALALFALPAGAHTGHVYASQDCFQWSVTVTLDNNVMPDHFVEITTTIPGTTGIVDAHYDTTSSNGPTEIWHASGVAPESGTVTLTILNADRSVDSTDSASLPQPQDCATTTTTAAPTTTTAPPETTTTAAPTTSTAVEGTTVLSPTTTTAAPPQTTTTLGQLGSTVPLSSATTTTAAQPAGIVGELPRTGTGTFYAMTFGLCCLAGGGLLALRRRGRLWTR